MPKKVVAGIDVGTTKICTCIAEVDGEKVRVLGTGLVPSKGMKKGSVVNLSETTASVRSSLEKAEKEAGTVIESAYVSVGGRFIRSLNRAAETEVRGKAGRVSPDDVVRAVSDAQHAEVPDDYQIVHVLTQGFSVDGQDEIRDPIGMIGARLKVRLHLVYNATAVVQNIVNAINKAGVVVSGIVLQQLASSEAVLTEDEKELGTVLVDVGGGTTDIAVYNRDTIWHSEVLPIGGNLITKDIAFGLRAPLQDAENLKMDVGSVYPDLVPEEELIEIAEMGTGKVQAYKRRLLCQIVEARCDEMLTSVASCLTNAGVQSNLFSGVVLTGGGALLDGFVERAQEILQLPVRLGQPINVEFTDPLVAHPSYATAVGLALYARRLKSDDLSRIAGAAISGRPKGRAERLKNWIFEKIG